MLKLDYYYPSELEVRFSRCFWGTEFCTISFCNNPHSTLCRQNMSAISGTIITDCMETNCQSAWDSYILLGRKMEHPPHLQWGSFDCDRVKYNSLHAHFNIYRHSDLIQYNGEKCSPCSYAPFYLMAALAFPLIRSALDSGRRRHSCRNHNYLLPTTNFFCIRNCSQSLHCVRFLS